MYRTNKFRKPNEVQPPPNYQNTHEPIPQPQLQPQLHPQLQPLPLPPIPGASANLRSAHNQIINTPNQFYPQLPPPPSSPPGPLVNHPITDYNQYLPQQNPPVTAYSSNAPSAPKGNNNIKFRVSCSTNDGDSDTSF